MAFVNAQRSNPRFQNYVSAILAIHKTGECLESFTVQGVNNAFDTISQSLGPLPECTDQCSKPRSGEGKRSKRKWCSTCQKWKEKLEIFHRNPKQIKWDNMHSWLWPKGSSEIVEVFANSQKPNLQDVTTIFSIWNNCLEFDEEIVEKSKTLRDERNDLFHNRYHISSERRDEIINLIRQLIHIEDIRQTISDYSDLVKILEELESKNVWFDQSLLERSIKELQNQQNRINDERIKQLEEHIQQLIIEKKNDSDLYGYNFIITGAVSSITSLAFIWTIPFLYTAIKTPAETDVQVYGMCGGEADVILAIPFVNMESSEVFAEGLINLTSYFIIDEENIRVGLLLYGVNTSVILSPLESADRAKINTRITILSRIQRNYTGRFDNRNFTLMLETMMTLFDLSSPYARKIGVVFSEGIVSSSIEEAMANIAAAKHLNESGVVMFNVGLQVRQAVRTEFESIGTDFCRLFSAGEIKSGIEAVIPFIASGVCSELDPSQFVQYPKKCFPKHYPSVSPLEFTCPDDGHGLHFYQDVNNCAYFYSCADKDQKTQARLAKRHMCPGSTFFNPEWTNGTNLCVDDVGSVCLNTQSLSLTRTAYGFMRSVHKLVLYYTLFFKNYLEKTFEIKRTDDSLSIHFRL